MSSGETFRVAAIQAAPVFLDRAATVAKACDLIRAAGLGGASLAVFPEAFVPAYPLWVWHIPAGHTRPLRELFAALLENSIQIPGPETDAIGLAAHEAGVAVAIGVNERNAEGSDTSLYNTLLYIGSDGRLLGKHRKLVPTGGERLVHAQGDGSDLEVYDTPFGRLGGLICWENYMPLARYTLAAWGIQIYVAPTWDRGEPWISTTRHIAKELRCVVVACCSAIRNSDIPDRFATLKSEYLKGIDVINPGLSVIVDPDGKILAGPAEGVETILQAEITSATLSGPRWQLDVAGHYARPDVFELTYHRRPLPFIRTDAGRPHDLH